MVLKSHRNIYIYISGTNNIVNNRSRVMVLIYIYIYLVQTI